MQELVREHLSRFDQSGDGRTELEDIQSRLAARLEARKRKDFKESDRIRDELANMGITLKNSKNKETGEIETTWEVALAACHAARLPRRPSPSCPAITGQVFQPRQASTRPELSDVCLGADLLGMTDVKRFFFRRPRCGEHAPRASPGSSVQGAPEGSILHHATTLALDPRRATRALRRRWADDDEGSDLAGGCIDDDMGIGRTWHPSIPIKQHTGW